MSKKIIGGVVGAVAVLGAIAWFGSNYYVSQKLEEKAQEFVIKNNLTNQIQWVRSEGRINKTATFYDVVFSPKNMTQKIHVKEVQVNDFSDVPDNFVIDLFFKGMSDSQGRTVFAQDLSNASWAEHIDVQNLPLMDAQLVIRQKDDGLSLKVVAEQEKLGDVRFNIDLNKTKELFQTLKDQTAVAQNPFQILGVLSQVTLKDASLQLKDEGAIPEQTKETLEGISTECANTLMTLQVAQTSSLCQSVAKFVSKEEKELNIAVKPVQEISLFKLFNQVQRANHPGGAAKLLETLNLEVKN